jgi:hypothetical protein
MTSDDAKDGVLYLNTTPEAEEADRAHLERRRVEIAKMLGLPAEKMTIGDAVRFDRSPMRKQHEGHTWSNLKTFDLIASDTAAASGLRYGMAKELLATTEKERFAESHAEGAAPLENATGRSLREFLASVRYVLAYTVPSETQVFVGPYNVGARVSLSDAETHDVTGRVEYLCETELEEEEGVLAIDARFARHLESIGDEGRKLAKKWREGSEVRWAKKGDAVALFEPWAFQLQTANVMVPGEDETPPPTISGTVLPPAAAKTLARALWRDVVGPRLEQERLKPAALVRTVHSDATAFHSRAPKLEGTSLTFDGRELARLQAEAGAMFDLDVIARGLGLLGSVAAHRLFRWEVMTGHERYLMGAAYPNVLEVEGGWSELARRIGLNPDKPKVTSDLRAIVHAQAHFSFAFPDGSRGNMLSYTERDARGRGNRAKVVITLGSPLLPGYVLNLPSRERKLVPLLREQVPLCGRPNEHGAQMTASLGVLGELRERARELVTEGGVLLTHDDFTRIADRSGLPRRSILPVRDHWLAGDTRAAPFLKQTDRDRYTLSDAHTAERAFLEEGGRQELQGAAAGRKSVVKKRGKLGRLGRT